MNSLFPPYIKNILVTGGAGFIGGALIRKILKNSSAKVYNLDKIGYASNLESINILINSDLNKYKNKYELLKVDLTDFISTKNAVMNASPDLIFHLAAESHVDRSIENPIHFIKSNINGTFNLLEATRYFLENKKDKINFRFLHVSTDEVFGSLGETGSFDEETAYDPRSPYSASKASSDHLVNSWHETYQIPTLITNCSNNYGPWQFPEKLIPLTIYRALNKKKILVYGKGLNIRDWLHVEDHVSALCIVAAKGSIGNTYCIGGFGERTNKFIVEKICKLMNEAFPERLPHERLIEFVVDRPGHDFRYSINSKKIISELAWQPKYSIELGLKNTFDWYLKNQNWVNERLFEANYDGNRIGI